MNRKYFPIGIAALELTLALLQGTAPGWLLSRVIGPVLARSNQ